MNLLFPHKRLSVVFVAPCELFGNQSTFLTSHDCDFYVFFLSHILHHVTNTSCYVSLHLVLCHSLVWRAGISIDLWDRQSICTRETEDLIKRKKNSLGIVLFFSSSELIDCRDWPRATKINVRRSVAESCELTFKLIGLGHWFSPHYSLWKRETTMSEIELSFNIVFSFSRMNVPSHKSMDIR